MKHAAFLFIALLVLPSVGFAQAATGLTVTLPNGSSATLSDEKLSSLPRSSITATAHGTTHTYEGSNLRDVLQASGLEEVKSLHGPSLRRIVVVESSDGYSAVFALSDLDTSIGDKQVIVTNREDGKELPVGDGPWRIVVASDKRPARWVRQITRISVTDVP
jgi:hypothetical protein